jgi:uncharacterized radical SAM superfamily protein
MMNAEDASSLRDIIDRLTADGGTGLLISGGCDINGTVPIIKEIDGIAYASRSGLKVNVHTGFISRRDAERLVEAGADAFSVDIHQDPAVIKDVLNLDVPVSAYSDLLDDIMSAGGRPVPHLTAGFGMHDLMMSAELVRSKGLSEVVLLALVPAKGTVTEHTLISEDAVISALDILTGMGFDVTLGCMRPRIHRSLEIRCIEKGVRRIANPSRNTISWAKGKGMEIIEKRTCCCFIH